MVSLEYRLPMQASWPAAAIQHGFIGLPKFAFVRKSNMLSHVDAFVVAGKNNPISS